MSVRVTIDNNMASGRRRGWTKHVTGVDASKSNGYALHGEFLNNGLHDLPAGAVLVTKNPAGSLSTGYHTGDLGIVQGDGTVQWEEVASDWQKEFLLLRDAVADALQGGDPRAAALAEIQSIMAKYGISSSELDDSVG